MARLEAASVVAFERLAEELAADGAPAELVERARRSADDEVRHAVLAGALARRYGARPLDADVADTPPRSLLALAVHNAVEGCIREALGAIEAAHMATRATDPAIREAMEAIARDEAEHAALSYDIDDWVRTRLSPTEERRLDRQMRAAAADHWDRPAPALSEHDRRRAGFADPVHRIGWLTELRAA